MTKYVVYLWSDLDSKFPLFSSAQFILPAVLWIEDRVLSESVARCEYVIRAEAA